MPSEKVLKEFYNSVHKRKYGLTSTKNAFFVKKKDQEIKRIKAIEKYASGGKILDVGSSSGFFLSEVKKRKKWIVYGLDSSKEAIEEANARFGLNIIEGTIIDIPFKDSYFDVITMHSVLEHIPNIIETIKTVNKKLKKGGYFVFNVPNIASFEYAFYKTLRKSFPGFIFEHLYYFTPSNVKDIVEKNGFEVSLMTSRNYSPTVFPSLRPFIGIINFIFKLFLEHTDLLGRLKIGNIIYIYAKKNN